MMKRLNHAVTALLAPATALFLSASLQAAEYSLDYSLDLTGNYRDNTNFSIANIIETSEVNTSPRVAFERATDTSSLNLSIDTEFRRFNKSRFDADEQNFNLNYARTLERGSWSFSVGSDRSSTRTQAEQGLDPSFSERSATRVVSNSATLARSFVLNELNSVQLTLSGIKNNYKSNERRDYEYLLADVLWQYAFSDRLIFQMGVNASNFESFDFGPFFNANVIFFGEEDDREACEADPNAIVEIDIPLGGGIFNRVNLRCSVPLLSETTQETLGAQIGAVYRFSEKLSLDVLVGGARTDTDTLQDFKSNDFDDVDAESSDSSLRYTLALTYESELFESALNASRDTSVTGSGFLQLTDRVAINNRYELSERDTVYFDVNWQKQRSDTDLFTFLDRTWRNVQLRYRHRLTESWSVLATYLYGYQDRDDGLDEELNSVELTFLWRPVPKTWSF